MVIIFIGISGCGCNLFSNTKSTRLITKILNSDHSAMICWMLDGYASEPADECAFGRPCLMTTMMTCRSTLRNWTVSCNGRIKSQGHRRQRRRRKARGRQEKKPIYLPRFIARIRPFNSGFRILLKNLHFIFLRCIE